MIFCSSSAELYSWAKAIVSFQCKEGEKEEEEEEEEVEEEDEIRTTIQSSVAVQ